MKSILLAGQVLVSLALILIILLQSEGTGVSAIFGGSGGFYRSKKGIEKLFVYITILLAILFLILSVLQVII